MRLWAIADIHLSFKIGESLEVLNEAFDIAKAKFRHVFWVPGNHELYSSKTSKEEEMHLKGEAKYMACIATAKKHGVLTPGRRLHDLGV
ncbi:hypothetical protein BTJ68_13074 [Hortaea werneckii EXF-2000]|uniref:Calcineurin-like phosphoesterase domain-containing protein n=1 Tax=Hortaea werneckii EXF-2000 TaxID=1157616 RepID=A0A1Z5SRH8_HORWE|nr:hypothetical protein BTJ68_13074 [Hortaea werneckii EXF-2000]